MQRFAVPRGAALRRLVVFLGWVGHLFYSGEDQRMLWMCGCVGIREGERMRERGEGGMNGRDTYRRDPSFL